LFVGLDRSIQEFELPIRATGQIEHAIGTTATIDGDQPFVVGSGRFLVRGERVRLNFDFVEGQAGSSRSELEPEGERCAIGTERLRLFFHFRATLIQQSRFNHRLAEAHLRDIGLNRDGGVFKCGGRHGDVRNAEITVRGGAADYDGIDGAEARGVDLG
jgi:hypothetical protein